MGVPSVIGFRPSMPPPILAPPRPEKAAGGGRPAASRITERLREGRVFKKIDSTMRGAVGPEVEALLGVAQARTALVCPAFPAEGRTVVGGILRVHGLPAPESPVGRDPDYPAPTADLLEILEP